MEDAHAVVATAWPTAYPVFNARCAGKRFYLVQDFEPYFHPVGSFSVLAENTYRMGFHGIAAAPWLAEKLAAEYGMTTDYFEFGCDTSRYHLLPRTKRSGVAFYCRPGAPRRGFELALMALEAFASRRPDVELHFYGTKIGKLPYAIVDHGPVTPEQLNRIYNRCYAGLSLSLTNVSLVPHEMLAAGCIPVVNDAEHNRMVLQNPFVRYVRLEPHAIASELESIVEAGDFESLSRTAAESVRSRTWEDAGREVDLIFRSAIDCKTSSHARATEISVER
jgi:glycosyltransferase involved in cell wall biosynthesis